MTSKAGDSSHRPRGRKYAVSANRASSRHRVRYVEVGGSAVDEGECVFCDTAPEPASDHGDREGDARKPGG
ncbi:MAG: hypothetical protein R3175_15815 [Marinobacter sp.]|uniref:hypothetical protein n=1 Tax=Marinobacter sp. TaxID=50741 RepID=UPI00299D91AE|nr:hypothetical protein [Marinobacter sp.]MDX1757523.1 hypothetical protein [Marinobacter sp.]